MAASILRRAAAAGAMILLSGLGLRAATAATAAAETINLEAQSLEGTGTSDLLFHKVKISQGQMSIAADLAHATAGLDFENSHWVFRGNVKIAMEQGLLNSDEADAAFVNKLLVKAVVHGKPAAFAEHSDKLGKTVQGRADDIEYDVAKSLVHLHGNAWISDGPNELRGESVKYNLRDHLWVAEGPDQNSQRVHITITPPKQPAPAAPNGTKP